jgi:hypothetical protein
MQQLKLLKRAQLLSRITSGPFTRTVTYRTGCSFECAQAHNRRDRSDAACTTCLSSCKLQLHSSHSRRHTRGCSMNGEAWHTHDSGCAELETTLGASEPTLSEYILDKYEKADGSAQAFRNVLQEEAGIEGVHVDRLHALIKTLKVRCHPVLRLAHREGDVACITGWPT